jgi:hypothetical protein
MALRRGFIFFCKTGTISPGARIDCARGDVDQGRAEQIDESGRCMNARKRQSAAFQTTRRWILRQFSGGMHQTPMFCFAVDTWSDTYIYFI